MVKSFSELRNSSNTLKKIQEKVKKTDYKDDRFWSCEMDKAGTGSAVIRFLPPPQGEELPFQKRYHYYFKGPSGKTFYENCPTSIRNEGSPILDYNNKLWERAKNGDKAAEKQARDQKRRVKYFTNVYVVKDPANPENEGKVFLFEFGPAIFKKIEAMIEPKFEDDQPVNVFDFWEGANFKLRITRDGEYASYDNSTFDNPGPLFEDDEKLKQVWEAQHSLTQFVAPELFKDNEALAKKFFDIIEESADYSKTVEEDSVEDDAELDSKMDELLNSSDDDILEDTSEIDELDDIKSLLEDD